MKRLYAMLILMGLAAILTVGCDKDWDHNPIAPDTDTVTVYVTEIDTLIIENPPDTVIRVINHYDTVYYQISNVLYIEQDTLRINWGMTGDVVQLDNEEGFDRVLLGFDRTILGPKPQGKEPIIRVNGYEQYLSVYGPNTQMFWIGPLDLPAHSEVTIEFVQPAYGKVTCHDYWQTTTWIVLNADSVTYQP